MSASDVPGPQLSQPIPLRKQLTIYDAYVACEDVSQVAKAYELSPEVTQAIVDRVPRELIPLTQLRRVRACINLEELAQLAIDRLQALHTQKPWTLKQCLSILSTAGTHFGRLLSADVPVMMQQSTTVITGEAISDAIRTARANGESIAIDPSKGNGNRMAGL